MHCKECGCAIPSTTRICPNCGRMATSSQMRELKQFNKDYDVNTSNIRKNNYKEQENKKNIKGVLFVPIVLLIIVIIALIKLISG